MRFIARKILHTLTASILAGGPPGLAGGRAAEAREPREPPSITLTIAAAGGGAVVTEGGEGAFSVLFGGVNGLGVGATDPGVSVSISAGGATYITPVTITPIFAGFNEGARATVRVYQDVGVAGGSQGAAREGGTPGASAPVPTSRVAANIVITGLASGSSVTRYVGVFVTNANGAGRASGPLAPRIIYEVSVN